MLGLAICFGDRPLRHALAVARQKPAVAEAALSLAVAVEQRAEITFPVFGAALGFETGNARPTFPFVRKESRFAELAAVLAIAADLDA